MCGDEMLIYALLPIIHLKKNPRHAYLLSFIIALSILVLSLSPLHELPDVPGNDKTHHLIAYAILAFPTSVTNQKVLSMTLLFILMGGAIEIIQPYVNRYGEWLDFIANTIGVVIGLAIGLFLNKLIKD